MSITQPSGGALADAPAAAAHRHSAAAVRAEHLTSVAFGLMSVHDVIAAAGEPDGKPLLRISIAQLLKAQDGWGGAKTSSVLARVCRYLRIPAVAHNDRTLTLAWLLDPRARGHRLLAFADAMSHRDCDPPWPGFPFTAAPATRNTLEH